MINIDRKLRLRDLEVYRFFKDNRMLAYIIIEDTKRPYTEQEKQLEPLCFLDEEDLNAIVNVFKIYILNDKPILKENSFLIRDFFGQLVNNSAQTNYIIQECVYASLFDDIDNYSEIAAYQKMLERVGSTYKIQPILDQNWLYLAQD